MVTRWDVNHVFIPWSTITREHNEQMSLRETLVVFFGRVEIDVGLDEFVKQGQIIVKGDKESFDPSLVKFWLPQND